jgi:hypothetical protein
MLEEAAWWRRRRTRSLVSVLSVALSVSFWQFFAVNLVQKKYFLRIVHSIIYIFIKYV